MDVLRNKARDLLAQGQVQVVIGYEAGTSGARRPSFARSEADAARLMWDADCVGNLAGYLTRPEIKKMGKAAIVANAATLRALLQLTAEHQLAEGAVLALVVTEEGAVLELSNAQAVTEQVATLPSSLSAADREKLERLMALSREERRAFWEQELQRCVKCYACRSSCPMCYCGSCTMDCNRPQWVPVASHELGNLEYHTVRAMHLAGRCVQCGECGRACPVGIPIHLLTCYAEESVRRQFGQPAGTSATLNYALGNFRPDDQESFIR
ncbi:MAG: 4Fe-4S dicluster domain-containing protein [Candidatus Contendobacter sp.]|nr:4Fe-4S dicluster domain-containing protein [Candidatus Contendobacter sp.]